MINPNIPTPVEFDTIKIYRPVGCDRTLLAIDALDARTRELAQKTFLAFNGKMINCFSMQIEVPSGNLILRIPKDGYELIDAHPNEGTTIAEASVAEARTK